MRVGDVHIQVGKFVKYLGLCFDSRWSFEEYFERLIPQIEKIAGGMQGLLPKLEGLKVEVLRLYACVVHSIALYGALVWSQKLSSVQRLSKAQ